MFTMSSTSGSRPQTASDFKPTQYPIGSLQGLAMVKANAKLDHFLASLILVCMIIAMYLANLRGELTEVRKLIDGLLGGGDDRADM